MISLSQLRTLLYKGDFMEISKTAAASVSPEFKAKAKQVESAKADTKHVEEKRDNARLEEIKKATQEIQKSADTVKADFISGMKQRMIEAKKAAEPTPANGTVKADTNQLLNKEEGEKVDQLHFKHTADNRKFDEVKAAADKQQKDNETKTKAYKDIQNAESNAPRHVSVQV